MSVYVASFTLFPLVLTSTDVLETLVRLGAEQASTRGGYPPEFWVESGSRPND